MQNYSRFQLLEIFKNKDGFIEELSEKFKCQVCQDLVFQPVSGPCGHIFCHQCVTDSKTCQTCGSFVQQWNTNDTSLDFINLVYISLRKMVLLSRHQSSKNFQLYKQRLQEELKQIVQKMLKILQLNLVAHTSFKHPQLIGYQWENLYYDQRVWDHNFKHNRTPEDRDCKLCFSYYYLHFEELNKLDKVRRSIIFALQLLS